MAGCTPMRFCHHVRAAPLHMPVPLLSAKWCAAAAQPLALATAAAQSQGIYLPQFEQMSRHALVLSCWVEIWGTGGGGHGTAHCKAYAIPLLSSAVCDLKVSSPVALCNHFYAAFHSFIFCRSGPLDRSNASMASMASYVLSPLSCPHLPTNHASGAASPCFGAIPPSPHPHAVSHPPACPPPPAAPTLTVGAAEAAPCAPLTSPLPAPLQFVGVPPSPSDGTPANGPPRPPGAPTRGADGQNEESAALFSGPGGYSPSPTQSPGAVKRRHRDSAPIFGMQ